MKQKKLFSDLNKIAAHFKLKLSKSEVVKNTAFAVDGANKKLIFINEKGLPYFNTIDLKNVDACSVKFEYSQVNAGDLNNNSIDAFIKRVLLQVSHIDPAKSFSVVFYEMKKDKLRDLRQLIKKARNWRNYIIGKMPARLSPCA